MSIMSNRNLFQLVVVLFAILIFVTSLFNVIQYTKIVYGSGSDSELSVSTAQTYLVLNGIVLFISLLYLGYQALIITIGSYGITKYYGRFKEWSNEPWEGLIKID